MISTPLFAIVVIGLLDMLLVWAAVRRLVRDPAPIAVAFPQTPMREVIRMLVAAPVAFAAVHLALASLFQGEGDLSVRGTQGLFYLGWWGAIALMAFAQAVARRSASPVPASSAVGLVVSALVLVVFSSTTRFMEVFSADGYDRAVIIGLALVLMAYTVLRRLWIGRPSK